MRGHSSVLPTEQAPASPTGGEDRLTWTIAEAAKQLGVSQSYYYQSVKKGTLPAIELGRRLVVPKVALIRLIEQRLAEQASATKPAPAGGEAA